LRATRPPGPGRSFAYSTCPAQVAGMATTLIRRGPWGYIQANCKVS
jgi:hypothetical protein